MPKLITLASGLRLACVDQGAPSTFGVVFVPGPTDSCVSYEPVLGRMPSSSRCVAVSPRGHGDSDKPDDGYGVEHFAIDVVLLLDALGIERAVLVGHSASCLTVRRVALDHPDRVAGLVLEASPTTLKGNPGLTAFVDDVIANLHDPIDAEVARSWVLDTSTPALGADVGQRLVAEVQKVPARVWREMFAELFAYDDVAELPSISAPALLVWGDADKLVGRDRQDELVAQLQRATLVVYAGVGHTPRWEDPERFAADVAAFAERVRGK